MTRATDRPVVIVTGASFGIGAATARLFADRGWAVVLAARSAERIEALAREIEQAGGRALAVPTDVTDQEQVNHLVEHTLATFGRVDALINNAGRGMFGTVASLDVGQLEELFRLNVFAPVALLQAVVPTMRQQGNGVIVNVSSVMENMPFPLAGGYTASKAALAHLSDVARAELAHTGIAVVRVVPGMTRTAFREHIVPAGSADDIRVEALEWLRRRDAGVAPERVAEAIWEAVHSRPRRLYVTLADAVMSEAIRLMPGPFNWLVTLLLRRYTPPASRHSTNHRGRAKVWGAVAVAALAATGHLLYHRGLRPRRWAQKDGGGA